MKKPDTKAFFGIKKRCGSEAGGSGNAISGDSSPPSVQLKRQAPSMDDQGEWEQWPDAEFEDAERQEHQEKIDQLAALSQEVGSKNEQNMKEKGSKSFEHYDKPAEHEEEWWDCPICSRPQAANEKEFNDHIDLCLSRQAIKEAVQDEKRAASEDGDKERESHTLAQPEAKRVKTGSKKEQARRKNGKTQSKLSFG